MRPALQITVYPAGRDQFRAMVGGGVVAISPEPLAAAARALLAERVDPRTPLVMRRPTVRVRLLREPLTFSMRGSQRLIGGAIRGADRYLPAWRRNPSGARWEIGMWGLAVH
jgi:hypothetical protein